ncbi:MAG: HAMP domain-containing sensor histidine kinase [Pigmentiphaga sp.]
MNTDHPTHTATRKRGPVFLTPSIEKRIRRTVLGAILITFFATALSVLVANESLEQALLDLDFQAERELVLDNARPGEILVWDTPTLKAYYVPAGVPPDSRLPALFRGFPTPFSGEVEINGATFLVTTDQVRGGQFFLAKDISPFELRETAFHRFLGLLGFLVILLGIILSRLTVRHLVAPLKQLTHQIRSTTPAAHIRRIPENHQDRELQEIALSFNRFLSELEAYVKREQSLMGLASHELRTPIAVIAGALDVLEQRGLPPAEQAPFLRIRRAVDEMAANIDTLLKLTRRKSLVERHVPIDLVRLMGEVKEDLNRHGSASAERLTVTAAAFPTVTEDPALVKMLLRNLVHNATQHTEGQVKVRINPSSVEIEDEGAGLPPAYLAYLTDPLTDAAELLAFSGLGLFLVTLICERLGWTLQAEAPAGQGTRLRLLINTGPPII